MNPLLQDLIFAVSAFFAGAINSIAGGGTLLTYPALLAAGISPIHANATSSLSLVPGALAAFWGYRGELKGDGLLLAALAVPSLLGAVIGAVIVLHLSEHHFGILVPWLILAATTLFLLANRLHARWRNRPETKLTGTSLLFLIGVQLGVAIYGGFFGAGMSILMLATLGFAGLRNLNRMNGLKSFAAACINSIATITFVVGRRVDWRPAIIMAVSAIAGGYAGARIAQRIPQPTARRAVIGIGFAAAAVSFWKAF